MENVADFGRVPLDLYHHVLCTTIFFNGFVFWGHKKFGGNVWGTFPPKVLSQHPHRVKIVCL